MYGNISRRVTAYDLNRVSASDCERRKDLFEFFHPPTHKSLNYKNWIAQLDLKTCLVCRGNHGKIYERDEFPNEGPPLHNKCRCEIKRVKASIAGTATQEVTIIYKPQTKSSEKIASEVGKIIDAFN